MCCCCSYLRHVVEETTEHHYDLNAFVWASADRYLGFHYVTVTTMDGGNQSESVTSQTFSFNEPKSADIKCKEPNIVNKY